MPPDFDYLIPTCLALRHGAAWNAVSGNPTDAARRPAEVARQREYTEARRTNRL
jgi:hypothetical protein